MAGDRHTSVCSWYSAQDSPLPARADISPHDGMPVDDVGYGRVPAGRNLPVVVAAPGEPSPWVVRALVSDPDAEVRAGIADLLILKSAQSAFAGFPRDEFTTLPETRDRLLATSVTATWRYDAGIAYGAAWRAIRDTLLEAFATHNSESVQHTLYAMARAVLDGIAEVADIHLTMPNRHHLPVDLSSFGLENRNEIFVATEEPFGVIQATLRRS